ncbi:glycosyltransferase family 4 protein [Crocosphaera chwakensis]|uniref:Glycosyl transferase, group 1 n=1 Tax=Crocosphaera chwakensis CCY0110 TaxID=391612 RepID=A3IKS8_9CHRO|nr:glycosyltransferase family 4 protein [Crocosphaera chwakensis]EAZ92797.1 Glycosyl transferase, group 1 [Crocosphaera chwakensis CCY0110]
MKIAQIAPLSETVPPPAYGGTELVVSLLTDELVRRGHEVTLFATADSQTLATLEPGAKTALRHSNLSSEECMIYTQMQLARVFERADEFDLIHSHVGQDAFSFADRSTTPTVHTIHGYFPPLSKKLYKQHYDQNFISISEAQQRYIKQLNYVGTVYNAIDIDRYTFNPEPENPPYLAFLGRMSKCKGPHIAIEIAKRTRIPLKIAGKIDHSNEKFFHEKIEPLIDGEQIIFVGELTSKEKNQFLGGALATLFPISWNEPFGLVMIESMICGTPVIASKRGSTPEIIVDGKTGFLCDEDDIKGMSAGVCRIVEINREDCHRHVTKNFTVKQMVDGYEQVYEKLLKQSSSKNENVFSMMSNAINELSAK